MRYVDPPGFSPAFDNNIASLINNTLSQAGATQAALGDIRPDNTSAIIQAREAATPGAADGAKPLLPVLRGYRADLGGILGDDVRQPPVEDRG